MYVLFSISPFWFAFWGIWNRFLFCFLLYFCLFDPCKKTNIQIGRSCVCVFESQIVKPKYHPENHNQIRKHRRGVGGGIQQAGVVLPQRVQQAVVNVAVNEMVGALGKQFKFN